MKRVGPELKMPDMKVPKGVSDFYQDLRDRRLLPVIALVVVAIVAVPFLLGDSQEAEVPASTSEALAKASGSADGQEDRARGRAVDARSPRLQEAPQGQADQSVQTEVHRAGHDQRPAR